MVANLLPILYWLPSWLNGMLELNSRLRLRRRRSRCNNSSKCSKCSKMPKFSPRHSLYTRHHTPLLDPKMAILTHISGIIGALNDNNI